MKINPNTLIQWQVAELLALAVEENNYPKLQEVIVEAKKVGLSKEIDTCKMEFEHQKENFLCKVELATKSQTPSHVEALLLKAQSMGIDEGLLEVY